MDTNSKKKVGNSSHDRFILATLEQWETLGSAGTSARQISAAAGAPVSSIYHHFGSLERLLYVSQGAALERAKQWCDAQLGQLSEFSGAPAALGTLFAQVVDDWTQEQRTLAFAWRECQLLAPDSELLHEQSLRWERLWTEFWHEVGERFAVGSRRIVVARAFENESLMHMIRWRRLVDRAALDETGATLAAWLAGSTVPPSPWRDFAQDAALRSMPALLPRDEIASRIAAAASELVGTLGVASVTHRAVAQRTGLTLGTVSHRFKTKSALVEVAFEGIYGAMVERMGSGGDIVASSLLDTLVEWSLRAITMGARERGRSELFLATARDAGLSQFGAQLRYLRGRTSGPALEAVLGPNYQLSRSESALFSGFLSSQIRCFADLPSEEGRRRVQDELSKLIELFALRPHQE